MSSANKDHLTLPFSPFFSCLIVLARTSQCCMKWWEQIFLPCSQSGRKNESESCSVVSNSLWPHGLYGPWNSPDQNTGVGSLSLLQGIFPTQGSNPGLLHCRQILYLLSHQGSPGRKVCRFSALYTWGILQQVKEVLFWHCSSLFVNND